MVAMVVTTVNNKIVVTKNVINHSNNQAENIKYPPTKLRRPLLKVLLEQLRKPSRN